MTANNSAGSSGAIASSSVTAFSTDDSGWYQVTAPDADSSSGYIPLHRDETADTSDAESLRINGDGVVYAGSKEEAILLALSGDVRVQGTGRRYTPISGAFSYTDDYVTTNATDLGPAGTHAGPAPAFEDRWKVDPALYDYNDDFVLLAASRLAVPSLQANPNPVVITLPLTGTTSAGVVITSSDQTGHAVQARAVKNLRGAAVTGISITFGAVTRVNAPATVTVASTVPKGTYTVEIYDPIVGSEDPVILTISVV